MGTVRYGFERRLQGLSFEQALERVTAALKEEGFGVLTSIDIQDTLKRKLDVDFRRYMILGACNPKLAHQALAGELEIGLLLPCNVVIEEEADGSVVVAIADPKAMFAMVDNPAIRPVADEADARLRRVMTALA